MKKCAFLTIKDLSGFESYDHLLIGPMQENGWDVSFIPWDKLNQNWNDFDLVISDEAHRSLGLRSRNVFEYFVGFKFLETFNISNILCLESLS